MLRGILGASHGVRGFSERFQRRFWCVPEGLRSVSGGRRTHFEVSGAFRGSNEFQRVPKRFQGVPGAFLIFYEIAGTF